MSDNKPIISTRDRLLSLSIFAKEKVDIQGDGKMHTYYSACLQRSYRAKDNDEWQREQISLYPDELLKIAALCQRAYNELTAYAQNAKSYSGAERPAQSMDVPESAPAAPTGTAPYLNDDISF